MTRSETLARAQWRYLPLTRTRCKSLTCAFALSRPHGADGHGSNRPPRHRGAFANDSPTTRSAPWHAPTAPEPPPATSQSLTISASAASSASCASPVSAGPHPLDKLRRQHWSSRIPSRFCLALTVRSATGERVFTFPRATFPYINHRRACVINGRDGRSCNYSPRGSTLCWWDREVRFTRNTALYHQGAGRANRCCGPWRVG
jgi:hypothetical protein